MWITNWTTRAKCKGTDPDEMFVQGAEQNRAKLICRGCPVRTECLAEALDDGLEYGVWGGMTERERRALLRRRPDVASWHYLLERAREEYERQSMDGIAGSESSDPAVNGAHKTHRHQPGGVTHASPAVRSCASAILAVVKVHGADADWHASDVSIREAAEALEVAGFRRDLSAAAKQYLVGRGLIDYKAGNSRRPSRFRYVGEEPAEALVAS